MWHVLATVLVRTSYKVLPGATTSYPEILWSGQSDLRLPRTKWEPDYENSLKNFNLGFELEAISCGGLVLLISDASSRIWNKYEYKLSKTSHILHDDFPPMSVINALLDNEEKNLYDFHENGAVFSWQDAYQRFANFEFGITYEY